MKDKPSFKTKDVIWFIHRPKMNGAPCSGGISTKRGRRSYVMELPFMLFMEQLAMQKFDLVHLVCL